MRRSWDKDTLLGKGPSTQRTILSAKITVFDQRKFRLFFWNIFRCMMTSSNGFDSSQMILENFREYLSFWADRGLLGAYTGNISGRAFCAKSNSTSMHASKCIFTSYLFYQFLFLIPAIFVQRILSLIFEPSCTLLWHIAPECSCICFFFVSEDYVHTWKFSEL